MTETVDPGSRRKPNAVLPFLPMLSIVFVCVVGAVYWILSLSWTPYPPILANLTFPDQEAQKQLRSRVLARFPIGSSDSDLIRELEVEGFTIENQSVSIRQFKAVVRPAILICDLKASISWRSSSDGKLEAIETEVNSRCL
jgi:hypothetical protein